MLYLNLTTMQNLILSLFVVIIFGCKEDKVDVPIYSETPLPSSPSPTLPPSSGGGRNDVIMSMLYPTTSVGYQAKPQFLIQNISINYGTVQSIYLGAHCDVLFGSVTNNVFGTSVYFEVGINNPGYYVFSTSSVDGLTHIATSCEASTVSYTLQAPILPTSILIDSSTPSPGTVSPKILVNGIPGSHTAKVYSDNTCSVEVGSATANSSNGLTAVVVTTNLNTLGSAQLYVKIFNEANISTSCSTQSVTYQLISPQAPQAVLIGNQTTSAGYSSSVSVQVSGVTHGNAVNLYNDSNCSTLVGTSNFLNAGSATVSVNNLAVGTHNFYAKSFSGQVYSPCSTAYAEYQRTPPPVPTSITMAYPATSSGYEVRPGIYVGGYTNGSGLVAKLYSDSNCTNLVGSDNSTSNYALVYVSSNLALGNYTFYARTSALGAESECSVTSVSYQVLPVLPPTSLSLVVPTVTPHYVSMPSFLVSGISVNDSIKLYSDSACVNQIASGTSSGVTLQLKLATVLNVGITSIYAKRTLGSGVSSSCSSLLFSYERVNRTLVHKVSEFNIGSGVSSAELADVNSDGFLDLVSAARNNFSITVANGITNSTFSNSVSRASTSQTDNLQVGDIDEDGKIDIVSLDRVSNLDYIKFAKGNGDSTFQSAVLTLLSGASYANALQLKDFNNDGHLDLVVAASNKLMLFTGNGTGVFALLTEFAHTYNTTIDIAIDDLNNDGRNDVLVSYMGSSKIDVYINAGSNNFLPKVTYSTGTSPLKLKLADIDQDGFLDIICPGLFNDVNFFKNNGDGTFSNRTSFVTSLSYQYGVEFQDLDGDSFKDLVISSYNMSKISIYFGKADGSYDLPLDLQTAGQVNKIISKDFDLDGSKDLLVIEDGGIAEVFLNK